MQVILITSVWSLQRVHMCASPVLFAGGDSVSCYECTLSELVPVLVRLFFAGATCAGGVFLSDTYCTATFAMLWILSK